MNSRLGFPGFGFLMVGLLLFLEPAPLPAQEEEESAEQKEYRLDYERYEKIAAVSDPMRRADQLYAFIKERPGSKLEDYAKANYFQVLEGLLKVENFKTLLGLSERFVKLRPRAGETYYFYGAALRDAQRYPEAMSALAKCYVIRNPASSKAKTFLEFVYKSQNKGSLLGMNKIIERAQIEVAK
jgi:tetratricopeptide (TPR) repeat protein